jgi:GT2 family glycosyltransferase
VVGIDFKDKQTSDTLIEIAKNYSDSVQVHTKNVGVGPAKNALIKELMAEGCTDIFLMEDDILMTAPGVCDWYIQCAKDYKVEHLNFAHHGPANVGRKRIVWFKDKPVLVHPHCVGAFSYYTRNCLEKVGLMDENFRNVFEHVELTFRIIKLGMHPPFWNFADAMNSEKFLAEIPGSIENSSIRHDPEWRTNMKNAYDYWMKKHNRWIGKVTDEWK